MSRVAIRRICNGLMGALLFETFLWYGVIAGCMALGAVVLSFVADVLMWSDEKRIDNPVNPSSMPDGAQGTGVKR